VPAYLGEIRTANNAAVWHQFEDFPARDAANGLIDLRRSAESNGNFDDLFCFALLARSPVIHVSSQFPVLLSARLAPREFISNPKSEASFKLV
jgi:hypothetical protein